MIPEYIQKKTNPTGPWMSIDDPDLDDKNIFKICSLTGVKKCFKKGDIITHPGEYVKGMFFLHEGEVFSLFLGNNGLEKIVFFYKSPCFINETPFLLNSKTELETRALSDCILTFIDWDTFNKLALINKSFNNLLLKHTSRKVSSILDQMADILDLNPVKRIYKILFYLAKEKGIRKNGEITIRISQEMLAHICGLHRVTVARSFHKLKTMGLIKKPGKSTVILISDPQLRNRIDE